MAKMLTLSDLQKQIKRPHMRSFFTIQAHNPGKKSSGVKEMNIKI